MKLQNFTGELALTEASPEIVAAVQTELNRSGYFLNIDGVVGPKTLAAFNQFKRDHFLGQPGLLGKSTADALITAVTSPKTRDDHIRLILRECNRQGINDRRQLAYILATVKHETAHTYKPIDEYGGPHTRYAPYWGRGYVQLTWLDNYRKYSRLLGKNLVSHPELVKEPFTAAFILVHGFRTGAFTGLAIGSYINPTRCDYTNARRCINSTDKAVLIAGHATQWLQELSNYGV